MIYSVVGSGNIGSAVARQFARKGMDVAIANALADGGLLQQYGGPLASKNLIKVG